MAPEDDDARDGEPSDERAETFPGGDDADGERGVDRDPDSHVPTTESTDPDADGTAAEGTGSDADVEVVLELPDDLRAAFKDPLGELYTDAERLLEDAGTPLVAVGDIVTYHLERAGRSPDVAVVDGRTERRAVEQEVREVVATDDARRSVRNPPATLTAALLRALRAAIDADEPATIAVDGEEDLAALPAILAAPDGASVVYGQPDEGMVHVRVTDERRAEIDGLVDRMAGDHDRFRAALGVERE